MIHRMGFAASSQPIPFVGIFISVDVRLIRVNVPAVYQYSLPRCAPDSLDGHLNYSLHEKPSFLGLPVRRQCLSGTDQ